MENQEFPKPNPYSFVVHGDAESSVYSFITIHGLVYNVYFDANEYMEYVEQYPTLLRNGTAFGFFATKPEIRTPRDPRIFTTIEAIIAEYFNALGDTREMTVLLYHCDDSDGRQHCRKKLFSDWYNAGNIKNLVIHETVEVLFLSNNQSKFMGFISLKTNPDNEMAIAEFDMFAAQLANKEK